MFNQLFREFEVSRDIVDFVDKYSKNSVSIRFLLIRSLDKQHILELLARYNQKVRSNKLGELMEALYNVSEATIDVLLTYIESKRQSLITNRENELKGLDKVLKEFPSVTCGVRNDNLNDIIKGLIRDKSIKTYKQLVRAIDGSELPRLREYILWSYYNQISSDIIEMFLIKHCKVIPTLRKIPNVDFFLKIDTGIVPFDLKITHISDEYFNLLSRGLRKGTSSSKNDSYLVGNGEDELKSIKSYYASVKQRLGLPNYGKLSKVEMLNYLFATKDSETMRFAENIKINRRRMVDKTIADLGMLEWWNYKYQGERLFCNNNRLYIFVAYKEKFDDGRQLKGRIDRIGERVNALLDNVSTDNVRTITYHYEKEQSFIGTYVAKALSAIYVE